MQEQPLLKIEAHERRWIAISGLLFVVAWIVGVVVASPPAATAPIAELIKYYTANQSMVMLQAYIANGLTGFLLIIFAGALYSVLRRAEGESPVLSTILLGAGIVAAALSCMEALFTQVLAAHSIATGNAPVIQALLYANIEIDTFKLPILALMILMASLLSSRSAGIVPRWLAWVGGIEAVLLVIASGSTLSASGIFTVALFASFVGLLFWAAAVSVIVLLPPRTRRVA